MNNIVIGHEHTMQQPLEYNALHLKASISYAPVKCYKSCPCASTLIYSSLKSYVLNKTNFLKQIHSSYDSIDKM